MPEPPIPHNLPSESFVLAISELPLNSGNPVNPQCRHEVRSTYAIAANPSCARTMILAFVSPAILAKIPPYDEGKESSNQPVNSHPECSGPTWLARQWQRCGRVLGQLWGRRRRRTGPQSEGRGLKGYGSSQTTAGPGHRGGSACGGAAAQENTHSAVVSQVGMMQ